VLSAVATTRAESRDPHIRAKCAGHLRCPGSSCSGTARLKDGVWGITSALLVPDNSSSVREPLPVGANIQHRDRGHGLESGQQVEEERRGCSRFRT
jgi:hypothetical protein